MQWSKLRSLFLERLAPELVARIDIHAASYPSGGRTWVTFDGCEIACVQAPGFTRQVLGHTTCADLHEGQTLELGDAIYQIAHASMDECLQSSNPLVQAMVLLDKRYGKRRLHALLESGQAIPSLQAAMLAARLASLHKPPCPIICEHCNTPLAHDWSPRLNTMPR